MKELLANTTVEWLTWPLARHIRDKIGKIEVRNNIKKTKNQNRKKKNENSKTEEQKQLDKNMREEMAILDKNESMCHKIWATCN
jgi:hypothetical protein